MNLQYYFNYITIVEEGSLTAAARKLHIAQPALSNQVKALETAFGSRLFYRGARNLELTDAGAILYQKAKWMCDVENSARNEISAGIMGARGTLRLGVSSSVVNERLYLSLRTFAAQYPDTVIKVIEGTRPELLKKLQNGVVEAVLMRNFMTGTENFEVVYSENDPLVAAYAKDSEFFKDVDGDSIRYAQLDGVPLSLVDRSVGGVESILKDENVAANVKYSSTRMQRCLYWASLGRAVALVPANAVTDLGYGDLMTKQIDSGKLHVPHFILLAQKRKYRSQVINNFMRVMSDVHHLQLDAQLFEYVGSDEDDDIEQE